MAKSSAQQSGTPRVAIVGAGFGGLCMGIQLEKAGIDSYTIFERAGRVGGTWRANTYPGCECDIPSALYSFSFAPYAEWPNKWSHQPIILEYLEKCADDFGLRPHLRFNEGVADLAWDEGATAWRLTTESGREEEFDVVVSATGQLSRPRFPNIEGRDTFSGVSFHSAQWDHDEDLLGRRVAVIGNAASAIQFVPEIAPIVDRLTVFQRSANWMLPKNDRDYSEAEKKLLRMFPSLSKIRRFLIWLGGELLIYPAMRRESWLRKRLERKTEDYLAETISDPQLRAKLLPDYPLGAKRILFSDNYYAAIEKHGVEIVTDPIERIAEAGVVTEGGQVHEVDTIIYATGFRTNDFLTPMKVVGRDHAVLNDVWREGPEACLGMTVAGFPNLFFLYGPNTNLGHSSIVVMIESQVRYIMSCLRQMKERGVAAVDVRPEAQERYNREMQERLAESSWATVGDSWYVHNGKVTNNWPGRTTEYRKRTRECDLGEYELIRS